MEEKKQNAHLNRELLSKEIAYQPCWQLEDDRCNVVQGLIKRDSVTDIPLSARKSRNTTPILKQIRENEKGGIDVQLRSGILIHLALPSTKFCRAARY